MRSLRRPIAVVLGALALAAAGCGPGDPVAEIRKERARWNVELLSWAQREHDNALTLTLRVSGPVHTKLENLTFRVEMQDADQREMGEAWHTLDLTRIQRGGPKDELVVIDAPPGVEGLGIDDVLDPTPEQRSKIRELQL